jgi:hypothetical protein
MKRALVLALVLALLLPLAGIAAMERPESLRPSLGVIYVANLDASAQTAALITNVLGSGVVFPFSPSSRWAFEPSADFYWGYYETTAAGRAVPTGVEYRTAFLIGFLVDAPIVFSLRFGEKWSMGMGAGLGFNVRLGINAAPGEVTAAQVGAINRYFWEKGRFFMPSTLLRGEYRLTERVEFGFSARAFWPIFNLWAGENFPFLDQGIFGGVLLVRYRL